ncbi:MAG: ribonuclease P protein component [Chloroflexi bacterium]|nr:ribonuclease P protein component [Chloroflexota bacterium]
MERKFRLTKTTDFKRVRRSGKSYAHPLVVLITSPNELDFPRLGITASRAVGGAVQRNRAKRVLRSAMQTLWPEVQPGHDIVLLARQPILSRKSHELQPVLEKLLGQAKLRKSP